MNIFEKQVEAAAEVLLRDYQSEYDGGEVSEFLDVARAVLEAADAVVTEEQIAETILKALVFTNENSKPWADGLARDIAALFRGGAK